jgi:hypothetical protein
MTSILQMAASPDQQSVLISGRRGVPRCAPRVSPDGEQVKNPWLEFLAVIY